jgi:hypothetical protein
MRSGRRWLPASSEVIVTQRSLPVPACTEPWRSGRHPMKSPGWLPFGALLALGETAAFQAQAARPL